MAIEIVDFPMKDGDFPSFFVCLPGRVNRGFSPPPAPGTKKKLRDIQNGPQDLIKFHGQSSVSQSGCGSKWKT